MYCMWNRGRGKHYLIVLLLVLMPVPELIAQPSLVPSYHPVYEWLYLQRVKGLLPRYNYESLPLSRSTILKHLKELNKGGDISAGTEQKTLRSFLQEFDPNHLLEEETHSLVQPGSRLSFDRFKDWLRDDHERHLFSLTNENGFLVFDHGFGRRSFFVHDEGELRKAPYILNQFWRTYGSYKDLIGYHVEFIRAVPVGDQRIFEFDGFYSFNWKFRTPEENQNLNHHYEAYTTVKYNLFELSIGRGNLKEGVGRTQNLVFSRESIPTDWVRFKVDGKYVSYKMIHATLSAPTIPSTLPGDSSISTNNSPRRWTAFHKIDIKPWKWLKASFYEMINYSNRGAELAYINPVNRYAFGEFELQNQDNGWAGFSLVARPFKSFEAYTEILIDDLGDKRDLIFKKEFPMTSRFGRRYGVTYASRKGWQLGTEYTRIDPFTYSHPQDLNAHTDKGIGLGSQIGPNADRLEFSLQKWGVGRTFARVAYSFDRQGLDIFNENGERIFLAGASPNDGRDLRIARSNLFLDGDLHEWQRIQLDAQWEFKRAYIIRGRLEQRFITTGTQLQDQTIFYADLIIGF